MFNLALVGYNLVGKDETLFPLAIGTGAAFVLPQMVIAADARWDSERDTWRYGGGAEYLLGIQGGQMGLPLRVGYLYDDGTGAQYMTGGLGYVTPKLAIEAGARRQIDGGKETLLQFGLKFFVN